MICNVIANFPSGGGIQVNIGNSNTTGPGARAGAPGIASIIAITGNSIKGNSPANRMNTSAILVASCLRAASASEPLLPPAH